MFTLPGTSGRASGSPSVHSKRKLSQFVTTSPSRLLRGKSIVVSLVLLVLAAFAFVGGSAALAAANTVGNGFVGSDG